MVIKKYIHFLTLIFYFFDAHTPFCNPKRGLGAPPARGRTADGGTGPGTAALKPRHRGAAAGGLARTEPYKHGDTLPQPHIFYFFDDDIFF